VKRLRRNKNLFFSEKKGDEMDRQVDARGLSCPQPVLMTLSKIKELGRGTIEVLVDNEVSKENVTRAAGAEGWTVAQIKEEGEEYRIALKKE
jgi:TusA-related sulfurtransferase